MTKQWEVDWPVTTLLCRKLADFMGDGRWVQPAKRIVAVSRGGLIPGVIISHMLELPLETITTRAYKGRERAGDVAVFGWREEFNDPSVWVVDDIHDTGDTLRAIIREVGSRALAKFNYGALLCKPDKAPLPFGFSPHCVAGDTWVVFPWEGKEKPEG